MDDRDYMHVRHYGSQLQQERELKRLLDQIDPLSIELVKDTTANPGPKPPHVAATLTLRELFPELCLASAVDLCKRILAQ